MDIVRGTVLHITLVVFLVLALVLSVVGLVFYLETTARLQARLAALEKREADAERSVGSAAGRVHLSYRDHALNQLEKRITYLQDVLKQKTEDYDALQAEFEHYVTLTDAVIGQWGDADSEAAGGGRDAQNRPASKVAELKGETEKRTAELRAETDLDVAAIQGELEEEIAALLEQDRNLQAAATEALIQTGSVAVPALEELLEDEHAYVREWTVFVLGEIGSEDNAVIPALVSALSDADANVRVAASRALSAISLEVAAEQGTP